MVVVAWSVQAEDGIRDLIVTGVETGALPISREKNKLTNAIGGIKDMGGIPDFMVVIDTNKEVIAIQEAKKLGIPIVGIIDSNSNPDGINYPVPGNDDAARAINLYCDLLSKAVIEGISQSQGDAGIDLGEAVEPLAEELPVEEAAAVEAPATEA